MSDKSKYINLLITIGVSMAIGAVLMVALGYNPIDAYFHLFRGAFYGKLNLGTTLQKFTPLLITSLAFIVSARAGGFNVGVEGEMYLGAIAAAWLGFALHGIPAPLHILICFLGAMAVGAAWAYIPASLKAYFGVNEVCVTILLNYVAKYITSFLVNGPLSAKTGVPQTPVVDKSIMLFRLLKPSQANAGFFIGIIVAIFIYWLLTKSTIGYKFTTVGFNPKHAEYIGINPKKQLIYSMMVSGVMGGIAGAIEVLGVYGYFLDNFSSGIAMDGMLAALIVKNDIRMAPLMALFLAVLKSGALGMERYTGVPKGIVDTIIAIFIIFATMDALFSWHRKKKATKETLKPAA